MLIRCGDDCGISKGERDSHHLREFFHSGSAISFDDHGMVSSPIFLKLVAQFLESDGLIFKINRRYRSCRDADDEWVSLRSEKEGGLGDIDFDARLQKKRCAKDNVKNQQQHHVQRWRYKHQGRMKAG